MMDFTQPPKVVQFRIDDDVFRGRPALPAQTMADFSLAVEGFDTESTTARQGFDAMMDALEMVLIPDSFKRFRLRMNDPEKLAKEAAERGEPAPEPFVPIELGQITPIVEYLMSEYGMRPTGPSESSSDGHSNPASGTSSTESTPAVVSISSASPSIGS